MNKTLHRKLTEKSLTKHASSLACNTDALATAPGLVHEVRLLREAAKDLMQPRKEAIDRILMLAAEM